MATPVGLPGHQAAQAAGPQAQAGQALLTRQRQRHWQPAAADPWWWWQQPAAASLIFDRKGEPRFERGPPCALLNYPQQRRLAAQGRVPSWAYTLRAARSCTQAGARDAFA